MKFIYSLYLNDAVPVRHAVHASYGNNQAICLHIRQTGILIFAETSAIKKPEAIINGDDSLFADAIKKALLIYLVRYGKCLNIRKAAVFVNGTKEASYCRCAGDPPLVYSLIEGRLRRPFSKEWHSIALEQAVATRSKSSYDGRYIALHALLVAKSDRYEIERFTFYWMAMNALYNYASGKGEPLLPPTKKNKKQKIDSDKAGQAFLLRCLGYEPCEFPDEMPKEEKQKHTNHLLWSAKAIIKRIPDDAIDDFCIACFAEDEMNLYVNQICRMLQNDRDDGCSYQFKVFPFMFLWVPYKLRCASFHGDRSLPTFCYWNDAELQVIRVVNRLLDALLSVVLVKWLTEDPTYMANIRKAAENSAYQKA